MHLLLPLKGRQKFLNNYLQETIEKTDANGKLLPEMVSTVPHLTL